jgi:hypothetical protein
VSHGARASRGVEEPADRPSEKRVRRSAVQSQAPDIRARLLTWKQTPEPQRVSLRALARELGTSHQLLGHYLIRWEKWQAKEYRRQAKEIRVRAEAETRPWIAAEMLRQAQVLEKAAFQSEIGSLLDDTLRKLKREARGGQLSRGAVKMLRLFAARGDRDVQQILDRARIAEKSKINLPRTAGDRSKSFRIAKGRLAAPLKQSRG